jgi:hypothetical protein
MFGRSKPVIFDPYPRRRARVRVPRWLLLLLLGIAVGVAAVLIVQERVLPPRLSAEASARLERDYAQADAERRQLAQQLADNGRRLDAALADKTRLAEQLAASRAAAQRLGDDLAAVIDALPPDPRNGRVDVRAARFAAKGGRLVYDVVLTRDGANPRPLNGVMQFTVAGAAARGGDGTVTLDPIPLAIGARQVVRGSQPLPAGFRPQQSTVRVLDGGGAALGMRVLPVR